MSGTAINFKVERLVLKPLSVRNGAAASDLMNHSDS